MVVAVTVGTTATSLRADITRTVVVNLSMVVTRARAMAMAATTKSFLERLLDFVLLCWENIYREPAGGLLGVCSFPFSFRWHGERLGYSGMIMKSCLANIP